MRKLIFISFLFLYGCGQAVIQHPGAVNSFDNYAYDTLRVEEKTLLDIKSKLPTTTELTPLYDVAKQQYNTTISAYKVYHLTAVAGSNPDQTALNQQIIDLVAKVAAIFRAGVTTK